MDNSIDQGTAELIRELTGAGAAIREVPGGNTPLVVIPEEYKAVGLGEFVHNDRSERPYRIKQTVEVWDGASFIEYFTKFSDECSRVFADVSAATVTAILDYHQDNAEGVDTKPRWGSHKLTLSLKKSAEWLLWTRSNKVSMDQDAFATFIEDNAPDITSPTAATMKEIASDLHETSSMTFGATAKAANGASKLTFTDEKTTTFGKAAATVPEAFQIAIPVYQGGAIIDLVARLRWRVNSGKAMFWYDLLRSDAVERAAFDATRLAIELAITTKVISGVAR